MANTIRFAWDHERIICSLEIDGTKIKYIFPHDLKPNLGN